MSVCAFLCLGVCVPAHTSVCLHSMTGQREAPREWQDHKGGFAALCVNGVSC